MRQKIIENLSHSQAQLIVEAAQTPESNGLKPFFMQGIFIQGGVTNHNKRIYPVDEIRKAVDKINGILQDGDAVLGECDHPEELNISLDRVSHHITRMWMDGPNGMGKLKILATPTGNIVRVLLEAGIRLGVSSRGQGEVDNRGYVSDFDMETVDIVAKPSAPKAYPSLVHEAYNAKRGAIIEDLANNYAFDDSAKIYLKDELRTWINSLSKK
jgi:Prohead core protein serine protease